MSVSPLPRRARQFLLWLHILSSVGWMSQAMALTVLLVQRDAAGTAAAHLLDTTILVASANCSAASGFLLSATTPYGFFLHRWVLVKFVITVAQLVIGIFVLSPWLNAAGADPRPQLIVMTVVMASLIAFQGLLSVVKPWGRVPRRPTRAPVPPVPVIVAAPFALVADLVMFATTGRPTPIFALLTLIVVLVARARYGSDGPRPRTPLARTVVAGQA
ncbi:hypothetical protein ACWEKT_27835 [Nocardia takedensis]